MIKFKFLGLYSGCGGADSGFVENGFENVGSFDICEPALKVHRLNIKGPVFNADLTKLDWLKNIKTLHPDVIFSGAPCQGFSTAGKRIFDDPRNNLLLKGGEIAIGTGVKVFVSENVMGSLAGKHKLYWDQLNLMFTKAGYKTQFIKVNCLDIGMAQMRKRILFFAWNTQADKIHWPAPIPATTLGDVLKEPAPLHNHDGYILNPSSEKYKIALKIKEQQKLCNVRGGTRAVPTWDIPEVYGNVSKLEKKILLTIRNLRRKNRIRNSGDADPVNIKFIEAIYGKDALRHLNSLIRKGYVIRKSKNHYDLTSTFNGKYRRLSWKKPCPTVDTRFGNPIYFLHPEENRGFTVREAARIQGFDDSFLFSGSLQEQFRMIGNAVPPPLSRIIAKITKEQLLF